MQTVEKTLTIGVGYGVRAKVRRMSRRQVKKALSRRLRVLLGAPLNNETADKACAIRDAFLYAPFNYRLTIKVPASMPDFTMPFEWQEY